MEYYAGAKAQQGGPSNDELLRFILEGATDLAVIALDPGGRVICWNPGAERLLGYSGEEILGQSADVIFTPEDRAAHAPEAERLQASSPVGTEDQRWHVRKDGSRFWGSDLLMPLAEPALGFVKIFRDCTREHEVRTRLADCEARLGNLAAAIPVHALRETQDRRRSFLAELQHRTRNLLGVVQSVERQTLRRSTSLAEFSAHFERRLGALSRVQSLLAVTGDEMIDLRALIDAEFSAIREEAVPADWTKVSLKGPPVALPAGSAQALALAIHELTANAAKYGALADPRASLQVSWRTEDRGGDEWLLIDWRESNVNMPDRGRVHGGFGSELIERALPYQLKARTELAFMQDGIRCTIDMAVDADQRADV